MILTSQSLESNTTQKTFLFASTDPYSISQSKVFRGFTKWIAAGTVLSMLGIIVYYVYAFAALAGGDTSFQWLLGIFSDFVAIMSASLGESPYLAEGASYPPIAIMVLYPFAWICRDVIHTYSATSDSIDSLTAKVVLDPSFWVAMLLFFVLCSLAIILIIIKMYRLNASTSLLAAILILFSAPFVFAVMRGNTIYFALIFLLLFLLLHEHSNPVVREIAYLCLVMAGSIKIYPLFFGVFLLHKKKIFASVRVGIYFFALFLLSFFLFEAGWKDITPFLENLGGFASSNVRLLGLTNLSVTSILYKIFYLFSPAVADSTAFNVIQLSLIGILFVICTVLAIRTHSVFSRSLLAAAVVILIPSVSYFYVLSFALIPLMEFFKHYDEFSRAKQLRCLVLFGFLFFTPLLLTKCYVPQTIAILILLIFECKDIIQSEGFLRKKKTA